jgi:hypothetical protein
MLLLCTKITVLIAKQYSFPTVNAFDTVIHPLGLVTSHSVLLLLLSVTNNWQPAAEVTGERIWRGLRRFNKAFSGNQPRQTYGLSRVTDFPTEQCGCGLSTRSSYIF